MPKEQTKINLADQLGPKVKTPPERQEPTKTEVLPGASEAPAASNKVVGITPEDRFDALLYAEKRDLDEIESEIRGLDAGRLCYAFRGKRKDKQSGKFVEFGPIQADLTVSGYKRLRLSMGAIQFPLEKVQLDHAVEGEVTVLAEAIDKRSANTYIGCGTAPLKKTIYSGGQRSFIADPFATRKALSIAQRNATKGLIPQEMIEKIIGDYLVANCVQWKAEHHWELWMYPDFAKEEVAKQLGGSSAKKGTARKGNGSGKSKESGLISLRQRKYMFATLNRERDLVEVFRAYLQLRWGIDSTKEITTAMWDAEIDHLISTPGELQEMYLRLQADKDQKHSDERRTA